TYGYDEKDYLQALSQVPIIDQEKVPLIVNFIVSYAEMLAGMVLEHQKQLSSEKQLIEARQKAIHQSAATRAIETDRNRLLSILDGIDDVIYVADPETYELLHVNEMFRSDWGEDVIGQKCYKINQNREAPCPFCTNNLIFGEYLGRSYVWEMQNKVNGRWYRCSDKAIRWIDGRMVRFEIATDITKEKLLGRELKGLNRQLERSNKELEQFAYVASHDLQEPLRMVASYTELLEERYRGKLDQKADKYIGYAVEGAKRMQQLINDLLMLSRVNTRGKPFEATDCNKLVDKVLQGIESTINGNKAEIAVDPLPTVMADEMQLYQLFQNLITNAVKFHGAQNPVVKISAENKNSQWIFSIRDNGIGIDPTFFERIFVIFQRLHDRSTYQGTGIGLAITKKIVERHGGRIWVESEPGTGSTFYFTLKDGAAHGRAEE
ncbi:MAG: ATP-binding protein, partial [Desulfosarcinaceae bacterium]